MDIQRYLDSEICEMPQQVVKDLLKEHVLDLYRDCGQAIDKEDIIYLCKRIYDLITTKYRKWKWHSIQRTFERGLAEEFGTWRKVTVKLVFSWLYSTEEGLRRKRETANVERESKIKNQAPGYYANVSAKYGEFIKYNLQQTDESKRISTPEEYYRLKADGKIQPPRKSLMGSFKHKIFRS